MTSSKSEAATPSEMTASAAWVRISRGELRGLTHALGNRLHSLEMTLGSIAPGQTVTEPMLRTLDEASASCTELVSLFRLLQFADGAKAEASGLSDIIPFAVTLLRNHIDGHNVDCRVAVIGEPPAVLVPPAALTQALLCILTGSLPRPDNTEASTITIEVSGDPESARIKIEWRPSDGATAEEQEQSIEAVRWLLRSSNVTVSREETAASVVTHITLPSLAVARRLERRQAQ